MSATMTEKRMPQRGPRRMLQNPWARWGLIAVVVIALVILPLVLPEFANQTLTRIGVYAVAVLGLNIVMGYGGQVNLGQIFFVGLGAYVTAYGVTHGWNIAIVLIAACVIPGVFGLLVALAAARLGGLAIAMVTIALPLIGVPLAKRFADLTGGSQGVSARFSAAPAWTGLYDDQWQFYIILAIGGVSFLLARNFVRGKFGRALAIVKENESVASSMGISPYRYKVLAFTIGSLLGGVSGFLYMVAVQYTSPETLSFGHSISLLAAMVIGGAGSIFGSLLGGAYYVFVPQATAAIDPNLTVIIQGVILLTVLFVLPGGLVSLPRVIRGLTRRSAQRESSGTTPPGIPTPHTTPATGPAPDSAGEAPEETERQGQA